MRNYAKHMAFSADGRQLVTAAITGPLALWDTASGTQLATFQERKNHAFCYPCACALSPDGKLAAVGRGDGSIILWDLRGY